MINEVEIPVSNSIFILALIYSTLLRMLNLLYPYSHEHTSFVILSLSRLNKGFIHFFHSLITQKDVVNISLALLIKHVNTRCFFFH